MTNEQNTTYSFTDNKVTYGVFSNFFRIFRKGDEIILDFGQQIPDTPNVEIKSRVTITVESAKVLQKLIKDFVEKESPKKYEETESLSYIG